MNSFRHLVRQSISMGSSALDAAATAVNSVSPLNTSALQSNSTRRKDLHTSGNKIPGPSDVGDGNSDSNDDDSEDDEALMLTVEENEVYDSISRSWIAAAENPMRYQSALGGSMEFPDVPLQDDTCDFDGDWEIDCDSDTDDDGWCYAISFDNLLAGYHIPNNTGDSNAIDQKSQPTEPPPSNDDSVHLTDHPIPQVRRRRWIRRLRLKEDMIKSISSNSNGKVFSQSAPDSVSDYHSGEGNKDNNPRDIDVHTSDASIAFLQEVSDIAMKETFPVVNGDQNGPSSATKHHSSTDTTNGLQTPVNKSNSSAVNTPGTNSASSSRPASIRTTTPPNLTKAVSNNSAGSSASKLFDNVANSALSNTEGNIVIDDDAFECDEDAMSVQNDDNCSVVSDISYQHASMPSFPSSHSQHTASASQPAKRRSFFSFGSSTPTPASNTAQSPKNSQSSSHAGPTKVADSTTNSNQVRDPDPTLRVIDSTLSAIGKQIRFLETEARKEEENKMKTWKEEVKPVLEATIADLDKQIAQLKTRIEKTAVQGFEAVSKLEETLEKKLLESDVAKRCLYFPYVDITLGSGGVYLALDDFWIEYVSGGFNVEIAPNNKQTPYIAIRLHGSTGQEALGVMARLQLEGFKLAGDKGKGVPKLNFSTIKITVGFIADIVLKYDHNTRSWTCAPKDFTLKLISFKGPYGLNRSIVALVLSLLTPTIRNALVQNLPFELGLLVRSLPTPFTLRGDFQIRGVELSLLDTEWHANTLLQALCNRYSPTQMAMFYYLQRAMDRTNSSLGGNTSGHYVLKNMAELMNYIKKFAPQRGLWTQLVHLWEQATLLYCEKVSIAQGYEYAATPPAHCSISFRSFLSACDELLMKRIHVNFQLQHVDGQVSLNHMHSFIYQIVHRLTSEAAAAPKTSTYHKVRLLSSLDKLNRNYEVSSQILRVLGQNMDFVQVAVLASVKSGPEGTVSAHATDICAQAPLSFQLLLSAPKHVGTLPLIPYVVSFRPQTNGEILLEVCHFNHDASDVPDLLRGLRVTSRDHTVPRPSSSVSASASATAVAKSVEAAVIAGKEEPHVQASSSSHAPVPRSSSFDSQNSSSSQIHGSTLSTANVANHVASQQGMNPAASNQLSSANQVNGSDAGTNPTSNSSSNPFQNTLQTLQSGTRSIQSTLNNTLQSIVPTQQKSQANQAVATTKQSSAQHSGNNGQHSGGLSLRLGVDVMPTAAELNGETEGSEVMSEGEAADLAHWHQLAREHKFTNYTNSIRTGVYSTSYNRVVNLIATQNAQLRAQGVVHHLEKVAEAASSPAPPSSIPKSHHRWRHLLLQRDQQWSSLTRTLRNHPAGEQADILLSVLARQPRFSVIVDRAAQFSAGSVLLGADIGMPPASSAKKEEDYSKNTKPSSSELGVYATDLNGSQSSQSAENPGEENGSGEVTPPTIPSGSEQRKVDIALGGVPLSVFTAPEIKLFTQIGSAEVLLHLPTLLRFVLAHFADLDLLRQYLESLTGLEFPEEHLHVFKLVLERMAKYLLLPVVQLDININAKLVALQGEMMVLIETPSPPTGLNSPQDNPHAAGGKAKASSSAIELEAQISLRELLQDIVDIDNLVKFGSGSSGSK